MAASRFLRICRHYQIAVHRGHLGAFTAGAGKGQQVLHQGLHAQRAVHGVMNVFVGLLIQLSPIAFREELRVHRHHAQWFL